MPTYPVQINDLTNYQVSKFQPQTVTVAPGDPIYWVNNTNQMHQPAMKIPNGTWNLVDEIPGMKPGDEPASSGILSVPIPTQINYYCALHEGDKTETGLIIVQSPPKP